jgi:hypothetical protein
MMISCVHLLWHTSVPDRHALTEVAEEEDQLALMNLSALRRRPQLYRYPLAQEILAQHDPMEVNASTCAVRCFLPPIVVLVCRW